jgi:hypothetical protein
MPDGHLERYAMKRLLVLLVILAAALFALGIVLGAVPVLAAAAQTETFHEHRGTESFTEFFCDGDAVAHDITITYNSVVHVTETANGSHTTLAQAGVFTATNPGTGEVITGHFTIRREYNSGGRRGAATGSFTFMASGAGDLGTRLNAHQLHHYDVRPDGAVHEFFKPCRDS